MDSFLEWGDERLCNYVDINACECYNLWCEGISLIQDKLELEGSENHAIY